MPKLAVYNQQHEQVGEIELPADVFGLEYRPHLLHQVVRKQLASRRAGTHAVKNRSDVSGGGRKPWKQKGTGRARQGSTRSPQWRGGGVVFGPVVRSHDFKVNKKEMRAALCSALSKRVLDGATVVVDQLVFETPRTRDFADFLKRFDISDAVVVVADDAGNVELSGRNIPGVRVIQPIGVNVYDVLRRSTLVMTRAAVERLSERLGRTA